VEIGRNSGREFGVRFLVHPVGCLIVPAGVVPGPDRYQTILLGDRGTCVCEQLAQGCYLKASSRRAWVVVVVVVCVCVCVSERVGGLWCVVERHLRRSGAGS